MTRAIHLQVEASGCPTICQHCWAQGVPYTAMSLADVCFVLQSFQQVCTQHGYGLSVFPMHEIIAHPQAVRVMTLFQEVAGDDKLFEPLSTTGVPLVLRDDWQDLLITCRVLGTSAVFLAVHGVGDVHDRAVHRVGAYGETLLAAERSRSVGLEVGCNVFLTKDNVSQFDTMIEDLHHAGVTTISFEPATYYPTARGRRSEARRPELQDMLPLAEKAMRLSSFHREQWSDLEAHTEAAYVKAALRGTPEPQHQPFDQTLTLVCRPNLDLYVGLAGRYRERLGNLRDKSTLTSIPQMIEEGKASYDRVWFALDHLPTMRELALDHGDASGQRIHFTEQSLRYRWLDLVR